MFCTDLDGDGEIDILVASLVLDEIVWWENIAIPGDLDSDGDVDFMDFVIFAGNWLLGL